MGGQPSGLLNFGVSYDYFLYCGFVAKGVHEGSDDLNIDGLCQGCAQKIDGLFNIF